MGMIFGTLPERILDAYAAQKPDAFKNFAKDFWEQTGPEFMPTVGAPIIDQFANRSLFTNRTLIPSRMEKWLPEYQYTPYTLELTKSISRIVGALPGAQTLKMDDDSTLGFATRGVTTPIFLENYVRGWTGGLGMYALQAADYALRKQGILPDPPMPTSTLADMPFIKAFVMRYPSASAQQIQDFYDNYKIQNSYFQTFMAKAKDGDVAAMQHIADMGGPNMFVRLDQWNKVLGEHQKLVQDIYQNRQIAPDEKRQLIDKLYYGMIQIAETGNVTMRQMQGDLTRKNLLPMQ
jgi:hypothetical protein